MFVQPVVFFNSYSDMIFSKLPRGLRKRFSVVNCSQPMIEKWRESIDQSESFGALLTDLSKVFDYLAHDLMIVKVDAYGLEMPSRRSMYYLSNRKQRVKANDACNFWSNILFGVPLGLILVLCYLYFHLRTTFFCFRF